MKPGWYCCLIFNGHACLQSLLSSPHKKATQWSADLKSAEHCVAIARVRR